MARIFKDGKFLKGYKETMFNPVGMTDDGYYIHVPDSDCDEFFVVKEHGRVKAFHPSSKYANHPAEIEPSGLFKTGKFTGRWYFIDTEVTEKERQNKINFFKNNERLVAEANERKANNIKKWKEKSQFIGEINQFIEKELSIMFQNSFPTNWGTGHLTTLKDSDDNVFVIWREFWDNDANAPMPKGTKIKGTFKIKGHTERNDQKQTILHNKIENVHFTFN